MNGRSVGLAFALAGCVACGGGGASDSSAGTGSGAGTEPGNGNGDGADESGGGAGAGSDLSQEEVADRFLALLGGANPTAQVMPGPCPMENPVGDTFFHVIDQEFPTKVFENSPIEFDLTTTYGPGPDALGDVVACVDGATGFLTFGDTMLEGMPMMDDPILLGATGETGSDPMIVGQSLAIAIGVENDTGQVGQFAAAAAQVCDQNGGGCAQTCANPISPVGAVVLENDGAVCSEASVLAEDGASARLGRATLGLTTIDGVAAAQSCVQVDFGAPIVPNTVRVVASWVRDANCGGVACAGDQCGDGHGYGVWGTPDGVNFTFLGVAQGSGTTTSAPVDPQSPEPPLVGEHFQPGADAIASVVVCRLGFAPEADSVALDYVELCAP